MGGLIRRLLPTQSSLSQPQTEPAVLLLHWSNLSTFRRTFGMLTPENFGNHLEVKATCNQGPSVLMT